MAQQVGHLQHRVTGQQPRHSKSDTCNTELQDSSHGTASRTPATQSYRTAATAQQVGHLQHRVTGQQPRHSKSDTCNTELQDSSHGTASRTPATRSALQESSHSTDSPHAVLLEASGPGVANFFFTISSVRFIQMLKYGDKLNYCFSFQ